MTLYDSFWRILYIKNNVNRGFFNGYLMVIVNNECPKRM